MSRVFMDGTFAHAIAADPLDDLSVGEGLADGLGSLYRAMGKRPLAQEPAAG